MVMHMHIQLMTLFENWLIESKFTLTHFLTSYTSFNRGAMPHSWEIKLSQNSTWLVTSLHDMTRSPCRAHAFWLCRACRTAQLNTLVLTCSTGSSQRARQVKRVVREVRWWAKWNLGFTQHNTKVCVFWTGEGPYNNLKPKWNKN